MGNAVGANIRRLRLDLKMTQHDLAVKLGRKSKSVVCNWETGPTTPPSKLLPKIAEVLDTTIDELFREAA